MLRDSAGLSVIGRSANTSGVPADLVGAADQVLRVSGTTLGFGTVPGTSVTGGGAGRIVFTGSTPFAYTDSSAFLFGGGIVTTAAATATNFTASTAGTNTDASFTAKATSGSTRQFLAEVYGPAAGSTLAGIARNSMIALTDRGSATPPGAFVIGPLTACDLTWIVNGGEALRLDNASKQLKFAATSITANGSGVVTAPGSIGPAAVAVLEWLTVKNAAGTTRYIPLYG